MKLGRLVLCVLLWSLIMSASPASAHHHPKLTEKMSRQLERQLDEQFSISQMNPMVMNWCGTMRGDDDKAHAVHGDDQAVVKLVYGYPADRPSRAAQVATVMQRDAKLLSEFMAGITGGQKSLRWDLGNDCSAQVLDVAVVPLPLPASAYRDQTTRFGLLRDTLNAWRRSAGLSSRWNVILYADYVNTPSNSQAGEAMWANDSRPDPAVNTAAQGGLNGVVYGLDQADAPAFYGPANVLHELTHMLGAVNQDAPHATAFGHCVDGEDVMCYQDSPTSAQLKVCPPAAALLTYDCGQDDYFNVAPAANSYLATHWNVYNSPFLCPAGACTVAGAAQPFITPEEARAAQAEAELERAMAQVPSQVGKPRLERRTAKRAWISFKRSDPGVTYEVRSAGRQVKDRQFWSGGRRWSVIPLTLRARHVRVRAISVYETPGKLSQPVKIPGRRSTSPQPHRR